MKERVGYYVIKTKRKEQKKKRKKGRNKERERMIHPRKANCEKMK